MGYVKDNFPGSPAAIQRARIAKGMVIYSVVAGTLLYFFSPFAKARREAINEGAWDDPEWFNIWKANLNKRATHGIPTRKEIVKNMETEDKLTRGDIRGPSLLMKSQNQKPSN